MRVEVGLKAEPGKNDRLEMATQEKLIAYQQTLSDTEINELVDETQALIKRQEDRKSTRLNSSHL